MFFCIDVRPALPCLDLEGLEMGPDNPDVVTELELFDSFCLFFFPLDALGALLLASFGVEVSPFPG